MPAGAVAGATTALILQNETEDYREALRVEQNNLIRKMDRHAAFREAAQEMLEEIPAMASIPGLHGPRALKIRPGFFSLRKKPISPEIQEWANDHVRPVIGEKLGEVIEGIRGDFGRALRNSIYTDMGLGLGSKFYRDFESIAFYEGLNDEKLKALGKNGVMLTVIDDLLNIKDDDDVLRSVKKSVAKGEEHRGQKTRAVVPTFQDMVIGIVGNIEVGRYSIAYPVRNAAPEEP